MKNFKLALAATALLSVAAPFAAQAQSTYDDTQQLIAQIQADKRAVVLKAMALDDAQMTAFTPIYDAYQADRKKLMQRGVDLINAYSSNYDSMTDDAAKGLLKDWFALQDDEHSAGQGHGQEAGQGPADGQGAALRADREQAQHAAAPAGHPGHSARQLIAR